MTAIATLSVPATKLHLLQQLVKGHNLRFCAGQKLNAYAQLSTGCLSVGIDFTDAKPEGLNAFYDDWHRFNTPIVEKTTASWRRQLRRIKGRLTNLFTA